MKKPTKEPKPVREEIRTLLISKSDNTELKLVLPPTARVTFGPTIPTKRGTVYSGENGYSLRVYEGKSNDSLIAVFCDVRSFRDIKLPLSKLVIREAGKSIWKSDEEDMKVEQEVKYDRAFVDEKLLNG